MADIYFNQKHLSKEQKALLKDGAIVSKTFPSSHTGISDYSFMVAPFAKAYEGFLKYFMLKAKIIDSGDYFSDHFRIGKVLNPALKHKNFSVYRHLETINAGGENIAETLWRAWKKGRNQVFHYFPHNLKRINRQEAKRRIADIAAAINVASRLLDKMTADKDNTNHEKKYFKNKP